MDSFEIGQLEKRRSESGELYLEFFRIPQLSLGVYTLRAGEADLQEPHREDEVYYCTAGRGQIQVAGEDRPVQPGSIIFVGAHADHRFHTITEDLILLVFFAPAEGTTKLS
jgi:mannose-6-phosphate isomerase-like protein (cupin superfamily)